MDTVICPVCGGQTGVQTAPVHNWIMAHGAPSALSQPGGQADAAAGLHPDDASGVARILAEGGDRLRLAAHP